MPAFDLRGKYRFAYFLAETRHSGGWCWATFYRRCVSQRERIYRGILQFFFHASFSFLFSFATVTLKFLSNKNENHRRRVSNLTRIANFLTFHDGTFVLFACRPRYRPRDRVYSTIERERAWKRDTSTTGKQKVREISIDRTSGKINCTRNLSAFDPTLISSVLVRSRLL